MPLFLASRASLVRYATTITGNIADAEDVVQEAWLRFVAVPERASMADPAGYLRRIVRNLALNGGARKRLEARIFAADAEAAAETVPSPTPTPEVAVISRDEFSRITAALADMPENVRIAVEMHRLGGAKLKDIAAHLGVSVTTAHKLVLDGIERCRAKVDRAGE